MKPSAFLTLTFILTAIAGTNQMSVRTEHVLTRKCGEDVTLTCSIDKYDKVVDYYWTNESIKLCNYHRPTEEVSPHIHCEYKDQDLKLTIKDVKPISNGMYFCILKGDSDHKMSTTELHVSDCDDNQSVQPETRTGGHACASHSKHINLLVCFTALLTLVLVSGV